MILVETSALIAIVYREPGYARLLHEIGLEPTIIVSAPNLAEALIVVERRTGIQGVQDLEGLLNYIGALIVSLDAAQARLAHETFQKYGKGRHSAALNFGDCLSYAAAKTHGARLLYVGEDFAHTDLA